ncbi:metal-dependent hydrolase family protein [Natranaeroarchaeum sulfidigenes]|uniref:Imidazolonepropionase or related amidohydrolase n=1 Tax=Natranaeroarchaeum sulfidigenes TaxID=2784880 RepID=A0A897MSU0_9EURY|nr:amidohydrolase family protein [Natranaeroarchaeum sulfidigenes]QSG03614.1 Imidazolonepropionase or related amidohydrolase [Natranaeroarchaeum sulfidigenes]
MILRGARVVDGDGGVFDGPVQFDEGRITATSDVSTTRADEEVVDLDGYTLVPGIVDAHVHFSLSGEASIEDVTDKSDAELLFTEIANARRTLESGVTGVRSMGAHGLDIDLARAIERGDVPGPRTVANCASITITGGHGHHLGQEVDGPEACRRAVREQRKQGAQFIKFMATGGVTTPGTDPGTLAFTHEEIHALVDEAHRHGVHVATHAHGAEGIRAAAEAGVDTVEHGTFLDDAAIEAMLDEDVTLVPTLTAPHRILHNGDRATAETLAQSNEVYEIHRESFRRAVDAGVRIAGGTDAGTPFNHHGSNRVEIQFMARNGMAPVEAITAMTGTAAETIGLDDTGKVAPGYHADLLVIDGDPTTDVADLDEIETVIKGGKVVSGTPLSELGA